MDDTTKTGPLLCRTWREAQTSKLSQRALARRMDNVHQSQVAQWEDEDSTERPNIARALELQALSEGAIPATAWGYSEEQVARVLAAAQFQPAAHTASDFTLAPELDDDHPPIPLDIQAGAGV